ncbi:MAG: rRNA maturation RNase YbeY [Parcubacteria group bacterium]|nr:rRNA maturation RNase YbeY [Parcubacteria group bacterium]
MVRVYPPLTIRNRHATLTVVRRVRCTIDKRRLTALFREWRLIEKKIPIPFAVSLVIVGKREAARINTNLLKTPHIFDVLAVNLVTPRELKKQNLPDATLGEIFITKDLLPRGKTHSSRFWLLVVHGLLHLAGYDHRRKSEALTMERQETRMLAPHGITPYPGA